MKAPLKVRAPILAKYLGVVPKKFSHINIDEFLKLTILDRDKLAQLVFVDRKGADVYEGDIIEDDGGEEFIATLVPMMIGYDGRYYIITDEMKLKRCSYESSR